MKIIHIAGGGDKGGAKPHIIQLCARLGEQHQIKLISLRSGDFAAEALDAGVDTQVIYSRNVLADYIRAAKAVKALRPDIVHCHGAKANLAGIFIKLLCRIPIVTTIHSDWKLDYLHSFLRRNTIGRINGAALRIFDYFTTVSDQFKSLLISKGFDPLKIMTIYNGIDFTRRTGDFDRAEYLRGLGLCYQPGDVVLGIPIRIEPVKDIPTLLKAFKAAHEQNAKLKLVVGGDGSQAPAMRQLARELELEGSVCFPGWINDVPKLFAACDIDVLTSVSETFPYSVLEGIKEGCAVITSDVGGMRSIIDHGEDGYIFTPGDIDALAGYILDLSLNHDKRAAFADRLYKKASSDFSLESMARTQSRIYETILQLEKRKGRRDGVIICGAYGRGNSGDEAILKAIIASMRALDPLAPITVMTRLPQPTRIKNRVDAVYTFNAFKFLWRMRKTKLFINGGGSLMQDSTSSRSLYFYLFTIWAAKKLGCKVLMYGCGIGPVRRPLNRKVTCHVLNKNVDIITLRDAISHSELKRLGITRPDIRSSADPALGLIPEPAGRARAYLEEHGIDPDCQHICFCVRAWKSFDGFASFSAAADYAWQKYGLKTVFLPIEVPKDIAPSKAVGAAMEAGYAIIPTPDDVSLTIALLKEMRLVCAMRLHALVFSAAAHTPFIASSYDIKVSSFMEYIGSDACCELDDLNADWLKGKIDDAMGGSAGFAAITEKLKTLEAENPKAAAELMGLTQQSN